MINSEKSTATIWLIRLYLTALTDDLRSPQLNWQMTQMVLEGFVLAPLKVEQKLWMEMN